MIVFYQVKAELVTVSTEDDHALPTSALDRGRGFNIDDGMIWEIVGLNR